MKVPQHIWKDYEQDGWIQSPDGMVFTCPHSNRLEPDGQGPCGCESPLLQMGLI